MEGGRWVSCGACEPPPTGTCRRSGQQGAKRRAVAAHRSAHLRLKRPALGSVLRWCDIAAGGETCTMASRYGAAARPEVVLASFTTTLKDTSTLRGLLNATECGVTARNAIVALRTGSSMKVSRGVVGGRRRRAQSINQLFFFSISGPMKRMRERGGGHP